MQLLQKYKSSDYMEEGSIPITDGEQFVPLFLVAEPNLNNNIVIGGGALSSLFINRDYSSESVCYKTLYSPTTAKKLRIIANSYKRGKDDNTFRTKVRGIIKNELIRNLGYDYPENYSLKFPKSGNFLSAGNRHGNGSIDSDLISLTEASNIDLSYSLNGTFAAMGIAGKIRTNPYTYMAHRDYSGTVPSTHYLALGMKCLEVTILILVKAKHIPALRTRTILELPAKLPFTSIRLIRTVPSCDVTRDAIKRIYSSSVRFLVAEGVREEFVTAEVMNNYLYKSTPTLSKQEYMNNVLTNLTV